MVTFAQVSSVVNGSDIARLSENGVFGIMIGFLVVYCISIYISYLGRKETNKRDQERQDRVDKNISDILSRGIETNERLATAMRDISVIAQSNSTKLDSISSDLRELNTTVINHEKRIGDLEDND